MSIDQIRSHFGFTKMPFQKDIPPSDLHFHQGHLEAVARIGFLVDELGIGMITGEVGSGKTAAVRKAMSLLEPSRHCGIGQIDDTVPRRFEKRHRFSHRRCFAGSHLSGYHPNSKFVD